MSTHSDQPARRIDADHTSSIEHTDCCIVGGGPGGAMLALLLARQGIAVTLLEAHGDFNRDFRGDALQPAVLEVLGQMGLADQVLALALARLTAFPMHLAGQTLHSADVSRLRTSGVTGTSHGAGESLRRARR